MNAAMSNKLVSNSMQISHDRFLILDGTEIYHLGASLKDLGKKWFAFTRMEASGLTVMERLKELGYGG